MGRRVTLMDDDLSDYEIRLDALDYATRVAARAEGYKSSIVIIETARRFEAYLRGGVSEDK